MSEASTTAVRKGLLKRGTGWILKRIPKGVRAPFRFLGMLLTLNKPTTIMFILGLNAVLTAIATLSKDPSLTNFAITFGSKVLIPDQAMYQYTQQLLTNYDTLDRWSKIQIYSELYIQVFWFAIYLSLIGRIGRWFFMGDATPRFNVLAFSLTGAFILEALVLLAKVITEIMTTGKIPSEGILGITYLPLTGLFVFLWIFKITILPILTPIVTFLKGTVGEMFKLIVSWAT